MLDRRMFLAGASGIAVIAGLYGWRRPVRQHSGPSKSRKRMPNGEVFLRRTSSTSCAGAQRNYLVQAHLIMNDAMERLRARDATCRCSLLQQSSTAARAGLAFIGHSQVRLKPMTIAPFL